MVLYTLLQSHQTFFGMSDDLMLIVLSQLVFVIQMEVGLHVIDQAERNILYPLEVSH